MRIYRLCKEAYSASVLTGDSGLFADGRWHTQGKRIVYCTSSEALAAVEVRVHIGAYLPKDTFVMHALEISESAVERLKVDALPAGCDAVPHTRSSQDIGDLWLSSQRSGALETPSIHSRTDRNVLLNPSHSQSRQTRIVDSWIYRFDARLFSLPLLR
jgi:RES domain-containing protein